MTLHFDSTQDYQLIAIQSVIDLFKGQPLSKGAFEVSLSQERGSITYSEKGVCNRLDLRREELLRNLHAIQKNNGVKLSESLAPISSENGNFLYCPYNFTIEMETGTGKTYTYLRTIYELNKVYGFRKFVIVVPSVAIREGTIKNLQITKDHFKSLYANVPVNYVMYDSRNPTLLRNFAASNAIEILVINIDSFAKDSNLINLQKETGIKPIEYLQATNPIIIIDEPQNMETDVRKIAINNLNPLCTLRYSATHRNLYNLIYSLNPVEAYDLGLVKQIEVDGVSSLSDFNTPYIKVLGFEQAKRDIKVILSIHENLLFDVREKRAKLAVGDDLYNVSGGRSVYKEGFILNSINIKESKIEFSNGSILSLYDEIGRISDDVIKYQIERAIHHHFEKEVKYRQPFEDGSRIKVLTLFFLDKVSNYRCYDEDGKASLGKYAIWFEEIFGKYVKDNHIYEQMELYTSPVSKEFINAGKSHETDIPQLHPEYYVAGRVHNGYFSKDKKGSFKDTKGVTKDDEDTYSLIMRDKERLLSLDEPLRFIFSHSALREGWDNPNVFQICTLNDSRSDIKKRQEIGRGLRLCVDNMGRRVFNKNINVLTIIANETYDSFSKALQQEISEETSADFSGKIRDVREKAKIQLGKELTVENFPYLFEIWNRINTKVTYKVSYNTDELVERTVSILKDPFLSPPIRRPLLESKTARLELSKDEIHKSLQGTKIKYASPIAYKLPDIYSYIQQRVDISKNTIYRILLQSGRVADLDINPQMFLDTVVGTLRKVLSELMIEGVVYQKLNGTQYEMTLFKFEEIETYLSNLFEVTNQNKTLYNYIPIESTFESSFARDCEADENIKFFFKLPRGFKVPTPLGNYTPDWAIVFENDKKVYFVAETKGSLERSLLREIEKKKTECGNKYFALFKSSDVQYKLAVTTKDLY